MNFEDTFAGKDGKKLVRSSWMKTGGLLLSAPLTLFVGYPLALVYNMGLLGSRLITGKKMIDSRPWPPPAALQEIDLTKTIIPFKDRKLDLVFFGVTGFTGGLAARYLAKEYKNAGLRWAIAGRRLDALKKIRDDLCKIDPELKDLPLIVADSANAASLDEMVKDTRVVCSTVGPFQVYGTELVKACVERGTNYCDITGEADDWVKVIIDRFDLAARKTGARIVHFTGHDILPWDVLVHQCAAALKENGEEITEIDIYDYVRAGPSGGTLATVKESIPPKTYKSVSGFDPTLQGPTGSKSSFKTNKAFQLGPSHTPEVGYTGFFIMSAVMASGVARSNSLNGYSQNLTYREAEVVPDLSSLMSKYLELLPLGLILSLPPIRDRVLPNPGEGPSEASMSKSFLDIVAVAKGSKGTKVQAEMYFNDDPGYRQTAKMIVESGLAIALESDKLTATGGVLTPASCMAEVVLHRLVAKGVKFNLKVLSKI